MATKKKTEETKPEPTLLEQITALGVAEDIATKIVDDLGVTSVTDLTMLTEKDLTSIGMKAVPARKLLTAVKPSEPAPALAPTLDPSAELAEGEAPSKEHVSGFAGMLGADPMTMMMFLNGMGGDSDLSGMIPIGSMVAGYNPKRRDMFLMVMGQVESRLGVPIVVIDGDGSINRDLTVQYIDELEEGHPATENNIYFDSDGAPHEVIRVGVDAQSIYDADPLVPTKALRKNGMGTGRVNWTGVSLAVRQVAFFAATRTHEVDPTNDAHLAWLRDHIDKDSNRLVFTGQAPRAIGEFNEAARTGSLPTLRVMLSRSPRRQEIMPRRRRTVAQDLSHVGRNTERNTD
jgi:hypothetical protein